MKRTRFSRRSKLTPDVDELLRLAHGYALSATRIEDAFWEARLTDRVGRLLEDGDEEVFNAVLDRLYSDNGRAYDQLADVIESCAESRTGDHDLLLFVAPVLAWSRYGIPSGPVSKEVLANARVQLQGHVFAKGVKVGLADFVFSPDQLPQGFCETAGLRERLAKAALHGRDLAVDTAQLPETQSFLSDTRFLIGLAAAPSRGALFRWQEDDGNRDDAARQWHAQGGEALRPLFPACAFDVLLPQPYHAGCRDADRQARPYSLRAACAFLGTALNVQAADLQAVVAPFHERRLEEFRIGFLRKGLPDVVHGVVWPLLDSEDETADVGGQIEALLKELGVGEVLVLDQRFPLEWCDDCGAPLYPNPDGEPVHAEMPEEQAESAPRHLH
ncbi:MAG TPA: DUF2863 family protein [Rhodocyclaceae bacterium]|nr:DUF2863 family protein [Rhodocyclaceae bacterium]